MCVCVQLTDINKQEENKLQLNRYVFRYYYYYYYYQLNNNKATKNTKKIIETYFFLRKNKKNKYIANYILLADI